MITQTDLFAPKVEASEIARIEFHLNGQDWRSGEILGFDCFALTGEAAKRKVRAVANASGGRILSYPGSPGYKLTREATKEEIQTAVNKLRHQAREMMQRAAEIERSAE